jgi:Mg/Co/Ni transporter MgtE
MYLLLKTIITALLIVAIAEAGKRFTTLGAILASLPITSLLAFIWLYKDTKDINKISILSHEILMMIIPSLVFFIVLPILLKSTKFYPALFISVFFTAIRYFLWMLLMKKLGFVQ